MYLFKRWLGIDKIRVEVAFLEGKVSNLKKHVDVLSAELAHQENCIRDMQPIVHRNLREAKQKPRRKE